VFLFPSPILYFFFSRDRLIVSLQFPPSTVLIPRPGRTPVTLRPTILFYVLFAAVALSRPAVADRHRKLLVAFVFLPPVSRDLVIYQTSPAFFNFSSCLGKIERGWSTYRGPSSILTFLSPLPPFHPPFEL